MADSATVGDTDRASADSPLFGEYYYQHDCGTPYERNQEWSAFFGAVADAIVRELRPRTVLDVGCAMGFLVEELRVRGVDAWGIDISDFAIANVDPGIAGYCAVSSAAAERLPDGFPDRFDLVTCVEVVEHLDDNDVLPALTLLTTRADRLLFSSSPEDYGEATHLNVRSTDVWSARLAGLGMWRNLDLDASFLTPWAVVYDRREPVPPDLVAGYERAHVRQREEIRALRAEAIRRHSAAINEAGSQDLVKVLEGEIADLREHIQVLEAEIDRLGAQAGALRAEHDAEVAQMAMELARLRTLVGVDEADYEQLRLSVWAVRDHAIAQEAIAAQARAEMAAARAREADAVVEIGAMYENVRNHRDALLESATWRVGRTMMSPVRSMKRLLGRPV